MIIKHPTALYKNILPASNEAGNISYTISDNDPPRSNQTFLQLPPEEEYREASPTVIPKGLKRRFLGVLFSEITIPGKSDTSTGDIQFEIGQVLDFTDSSVDAVSPYSLESVDLIQNNSVVDYNKFGLDEDEVIELRSKAQTEFDRINLEISDIGKQINTNLGSIQSNQANINSITKLYNSTSKILGSSSSSAIKLKLQLDTFNALNITLSEKNAELNIILSELRDNLQIVREVVR